MARFSATASSVLFGSQTAPKGAITARAENPDEPWIKLSSRSLATNPGSAAAQPDAAVSNGATPLSLASDDFNGDGFPDLVCGYATGQGGMLTIYRGNPEAFSPRDPEILRGIARAQFPNPFLTSTQTLQLPEAPSFLAAFDVDRDGKPDLVVAARGSNNLYVLKGNELGGFDPAQSLVVPGEITSLATGKMDRDEGLTDLAVGVSTATGSELVLYSGRQDLTKTAPSVHDLPGEISALSFGRLDEDQFNDLAILSGGQVSILHGGNQFDAANQVYLESGCPHRDGLDFGRRRRAHRRARHRRYSSV